MVYRTCIESQEQNCRMNAAEERARPREINANLTFVAKNVLKC